ncbi:MAG: hypothetical protein U9N10_06490 [Bacillota bacterium]|nr:hypothetical protein [Bacillota bacterium]
MKKKIIICLLLIISAQAYSQKNNTSKVLRINFVNPGIEYEMSIFNKSTLSLNCGVGFSGSYPDLTSRASGWLYLISPYIDVHYRNYYNFHKRLSNNKNINFNSANFFGLKLLSRGKDFSSNFIRTSDYDFAFGPTWGLQRSIGKINFLFDFYPAYYFDTHGNSGVLPVNFEINIGYNLKN